MQRQRRKSKRESDEKVETDRGKAQGNGKKRDRSHAREGGWRLRRAVGRPRGGRGEMWREEGDYYDTYCFLF